MVPKTFKLAEPILELLFIASPSSQLINDTFHKTNLNCDRKPEATNENIPWIP